MKRTGNPGAYQQPSQWGRNESGNFEVWVFEGTPQEIRNTAARFASVNGINYHISQGYGKWRLEVQFPWNADGLVPAATDAVIKWEMIVHSTGKYLLNAIDNAGTVKGLSDFQIQQIKFLDANKPDPLSDPVTSEDFVDPLNPLAGDAVSAFEIWQYLQAGQSEYIMEAPVLRRTVITSNQYAVSYAMTYARRILSTNTLLSFEQVPNVLVLPVVNLFAADVSPNPNLNYGWYKHIPNVIGTALNKWQIVQEWDYGWWAKLYGVPL